jgi:signal transduction histidine kinase
MAILNWCKIPNGKEMTPSSFDTVLLLVFFIYGLAFFGLGMALAIESGRLPALAEARVLGPLAIFGLLHGIHEWLEAYLLQAEAYGAALPGWLPWFRLLLLVSSFLFLIVFDIQVFRLHTRPLKTMDFLLLSILGIYFLVILGSAVIAIRNANVAWFDLLNVLSRYLLAVPGAILAAFALRLQAIGSTGQERHHLITHLTIAAVGFFIYGLAQFLVPKINIFPAHSINATSFSTWAGFPIQVVRAGMAAMITMGLVRATQLAERDRQRLAASVQKAHLETLEQRDALRHELLFHTVEAQEEERSRIARELHDETAQVLTAFSLDLATLRTSIPNRSDAMQVVDRLQALCKEMSQGLYRLVHDLRPAQLDDLGLIPAIQYLKDSYASQGLDVIVEVQGQSRRLDAIVETVLFRVVQEALNNVLRHAQTRQARVLVQFQTREVILKVVDSGFGFNPEQPLTPPHGWGLAGMRERVDLIAGQLNIISAQGKGTTVEVIVPDRSLSAAIMRGL